MANQTDVKRVAALLKERYDRRTSFNLALPYWEQIVEEAMDDPRWEGLL